MLILRRKEEKTIKCLDIFEWSLMILRSFIWVGTEFAFGRQHKYKKLDNCFSRQKFKTFKNSKNKTVSSTN